MFAEQHFASCVSFAVVEFPCRVHHRNESLFTGGIAASAMDQYAMYGGAGLDLNQVPGVPSYVSSAGPASQPIHSGAGATPASQPSVGAYPGMPPQQHISGSLAVGFLPALT